MRGSIYYQVGVLAKIIFAPKMQKKEQKSTGNLANAQTIQTYKEVWNELAVYSKSIYDIKDLQMLTSEHIESYMLTKAYQNLTEQRLELISSAIGKLETALKKLDEQFRADNLSYALNENKNYDFSIRQNILNDARKKLLVIETSDEPSFARSYDNPQALINAIKDDKFKLAAAIQYESGTRLEGVARIDEYCVIETRKLEDNKLQDIIQEAIDETYSRVPQMQGIKIDTFDKRSKGQLYTIEKGGKPGLVQVSESTYGKLEKYLKIYKIFKIDMNQYRKALMYASQITSQEYNGSHGLRWNFAKERFQTLQIMSNLTYEQALQQVSWEMKHERASITEHYLR